MTQLPLRKIAILGSTGSIGRQALEVIKNNQDKFEIEILTAQNNVDLLIKQAIEFNPNAVVIGNKAHYSKLKESLSNTDIKIFAGDESLCDVVQFESIDLVLTAMVGISGLKPTLAAINAGKHIALANKETLVVAGCLVTKAAAENRVVLLPVDSEHSAIFQCIVGEFHNPIEKIILTASGGPFRGKSKEFLQKVKKEDALKHPNWDMGNKITIDSASLMNKGLEAIEAKWLFSLRPDQIEVIVHPESIIHSIVQFEDGSMKAQMSLPDMKIPIQYALSYPLRLKSDFKRFNFLDYPNLTFEKPDTDSFKNLSLAFYALEKGGNLPCILNAANEVVVEAFLNDKVNFLKMPEIIEQIMAKMTFIATPTYDDFFETDKITRIYTNELLDISI
ncbi:MAG: 1-deoxy-D-xylulose-5-phosphate reductoisomerase [Bacteroidetes bacterium]|nr:1-deoxy-D-xylulose-5-phosphate reductoisomerase [Bacteroidota bacterium]